MTITPSNSIGRRRERVAQIVDHRGHVSMAELAAELGISEMTVRRDVANLADQGRVVAFYGGVRAPLLESISATFNLHSTTDALIKDRIAACAATLAADGSAIAIDAGSTNAALARRLSAGTGFV